MIYSIGVVRRGGEVSPVRWDPVQYERYADERNRPFDELIARVQATYPEGHHPARVVDLGCGPGPLTRSLADRWPDAEIVGVDNSVDMVEAAGAHALPGRVSFVLADLATWRPDAPVDIIVANAAFQWVPGHLQLIGELAGCLTRPGVLAFQVPDNFDAPSHTLLRELRESPRWQSRLGAGADRSAGVERPQRYLEALIDAGLHADVWQTEYLQVLPGDDAVLEWVKGTALRPVLTALDEAETAAFLDDYAERLLAAYPRQPFGTVFPFRRTFAVGRLAA
jgi:trans-aconitate 2-methyltransferase